MMEAEASVAGCCGICVASACTSWCTIHPFGADARCCGGPRGCCGNCCDPSFNKDDFDERMKREQARNGADVKPVESQPLPSHGMSEAVHDPKSTNVEA